MDLLSVPRAPPVERSQSITATASSRADSAGSASRTIVTNHVEHVQQREIITLAAVLATSRRAPSMMSLLRIRQKTVRPSR